MNVYEEHEENMLRSLPEHTRELLSDFFKARRLSVHTKLTYIQAIASYIESAGKPLCEACNQTVTKWYSSLDGERAPGTISLYATKLRPLYQFALERDGVDEEEASVKAKKLFKTVPVKQLQREADKQNSLRNKLVSKEEFGRLLSNANGPMVRAFLIVCYESGTRINELLNARVRDLEFHQRYALLRVDGKTGERTIPLVHSIPYLRAWIQVHPDQNNPDSPLFAVVRNGRVGFPKKPTIEIQFNRLGKRIGLNRSFYPHMLRHTRLTELASKGIGEYQLKQLAGWVPNSRMAQRYIHLAGGAALDAVLEIEGIKKSEKDGGASYAKTKKCPRCTAENEYDAVYCITCGLCLTEKTLHREAAESLEADILMDMLIQHPKVRDAIKEAVRELIETKKLEMTTV